MNGAPAPAISAESPALAPPLKWAGGKRWLAPRLRPIFEATGARRLVEPFVGGMAIALGLAPEAALLNDVNPHLINFYTHLRRGLVIGRELKNDRTFFLAQRARFNDLIRSGKAASKEGAELFYYLNRTGFNGLCRFNSAGQFNVPFGQYKKINYGRDFRLYAPLLRRWSFTCGDFESLDIERGDFLYVDPPYDVEFTKYSKDGFTWEDQERLVEWMARCRRPVVASNQATPRIIRLYTRAGFSIQKVSAPRMIACNGSRTRAWEILAAKNV